MAQDHQIIPASIVTPSKVQVQGRLDRARSLAPSHSESCFRSMSHQEEHSDRQKSNFVQDQAQAVTPRRRARVFRCLSNTNTLAATTTGTPQGQRSALKSMFQPPASSPGRQMSPSSRHGREQVRQAKVPMPSFVFFGSRLDRSSLHSRKLRSAKTATVHKGKVQFKPTVAVICIPSHRSYPSKVKKTLWGSTKEIKANAIRNTAEYIYDNCNWRKSTEEEQFYRDTRNGSLIHPVHVQRYYAAMKKMQDQAKKNEGENNQNTQHPEQKSTRSCLQKQNEQVLSRKRVRCCTPSPIRRSATESEHERETKRARLDVHSPAPRQGCSPVMYYTPRLPPAPHYPLYQQENFRSYQEQQPMVMIQTPCPVASQSFPPINIA